MDVNPPFRLKRQALYWLAYKVEHELDGDALDLLESLQLPGGGWAAGGSFCRGTNVRVSNSDLVSWGPGGKTKMNEWITADALVVLKAAGRLKFSKGWKK